MHELIELLFDNTWFLVIIILGFFINISTSMFYIMMVPFRQESKEFSEFSYLAAITFPLSLLWVCRAWFGTTLIVVLILNILATFPLIRDIIRKQRNNTSIEHPTSETEASLLSNQIITQEQIAVIERNHELIPQASLTEETFLVPASEENKAITVSEKVDNGMISEIHEPSEDNTKDLPAEELLPVLYTSTFDDSAHDDSSYAGNAVEREEVTIEDMLAFVDHMSGHDFEKWCAGLLILNGYEKVTLTSGSNDQGVDILAKKDGVSYAIQCKCYSTDLGNTPIQEVHAGKDFYHCHLGVVMTNRYFTKGGRDAANATKTLIWDRDKLKQFLESKINEVTV